MQRRPSWVRIVAAALFATCAHAMSSPPGKGEKMTLDLEKYQTAEQAKAAISAQLPKGSSRRKVEEWLGQSGLKCFPSNLRDPYIACRQVMPSGSMVHVVWAFGFFFSEQRELERIEINRGLSGP
jgi:hypothetical protein